MSVILNAFKVKGKDILNKSMDIILSSLLLALNIFNVTWRTLPDSIYLYKSTMETPEQCSDVSTVDFEQVNVGSVILLFNYC